MPFKTLFFALIFFLFISCAEEHNDSSVNNSTAIKQKSHSSEKQYIRIADNSNLVVGSSTIANSNSLSGVVSNLLTYLSGDLVNINSTINDGSSPSELYAVSSDFKMVEYRSGTSISEVYLVLTNDLAIKTSLVGIPQKQNGGTKNKKIMYQRGHSLFWISNNNLIELNISNDSLEIVKTITNDVKNFELQPNFIHFQTSTGQYIYKFFDESKKRLNDDFNAEFKNFVYRSSENCLQSETNNTKGQYKEFEEFCVDENGNESIRYARSGYIDCLNDVSMPSWCQGASQPFGILQSISSCSTINIGNGYLICNSKLHQYFYELKSHHDQIEYIKIEFVYGKHNLVNRFFDFSEKYLYMISGTDSNLYFSKIDLVNKTSITYDVSSYTKPNWVVFCNGVLDMSLDDKFVKFNPNTEQFTVVGSNEGIEQYECIE